MPRVLLYLTLGSERLSQMYFAFNEAAFNAAEPWAIKIAQQLKNKAVSLQYLLLKRRRRYQII